MTPRLWTRPLRQLSPQSSYGYRVIRFARDVLREPLDPWQQWLVIHIGELLPDGRPRFRQVLVIVGRQNGKTHLLRVLALYWLFVELQALVFGTSTNLDTAAETWREAADTARAVPALAAQLPRDAVRLANGQQELRTVHRTRYKIGAVNRKGGRGYRIRRLIGDELREHQSWDGYSAAYGAMNAQPDGQAVFITNQGDARAVVLHSLRDNALAFLASGEGDPRLGIFEWSAPEGSHVADPAAWAAANPQLGHRIDHDTLAGMAARVAKPGADPAEVAAFRTEYLCMAVEALKPAIDGAAWADAADVGTLTGRAGALAACVDLSPDGQHATLAAAAEMPDGLIRVEAVAGWSGPTALQDMREALPGLIAAMKPRALAWFPKGPAAALDADLRDRRRDGRRGWPPRGTKVAELGADAPAVCMGFAEQVAAGQVVHSAQPLLDAQIGAAGKAGPEGGRWVFARTGQTHVDAVYAAAGAVHLARTLPRPRPAGKLHSLPA